MRTVLIVLSLYLFAEIAALIVLAVRFGALTILLFTALTCLLGLWMLRNHPIAGILALWKVRRPGKRPTLYSLLWPLRYLLAGLLFLIPGVISDLAALLLLLPLKGPSINTPVDAESGPDIIDGECTRVGKITPSDRLLH